MIDRREILLAAVLGISLAAAPAAAQPQSGGSPIEVVALPNAASPLVALRLQLNAGSIHDPGRQGGPGRP